MLAVCYYPEQWPHDCWAEDARAMKALGITYVRIGEFAWSRLEPRPGAYDFAWLDEAIGVLAKEGLKIVLGTPTAAPPRWLIAAHPEILPVDHEGRIRRFGSRRHYTFSSRAYREAVQDIVGVLAQRYGQHPAVSGWQTDNEYGCHDTVHSYGPEDREAFKTWLKRRYESIDALNEAWANAFWSMDYQDFEQLELPNLTVTEANPAHWLDYYRFASDQVISFNRLQVDIIRAYSPGRFILHNFMSFSADFDHFELAGDLDLAGWDSYPLGFVEELPILDPEEKSQWIAIPTCEIQGILAWKVHSAQLHELFGGLRSFRACGICCAPV